MAYDAKTERLIALKKLAGKAQTSNDKGLANEALPSGITSTSETIFGETITGTPSSAALYAITGKVEYVRFQVSFIPGSDTSSGRHGFELKLPAAYVANSSNSKKGTGVFVNNGVVNASSGKLQIIPPSFATAYEAKPYYGGTTAKNSGTQIPLLDARDWYLDYYNGIFFQQDPPGTGDHAQNPDYIEAFLYIGNTLDTVISSAGSPKRYVYLLTASHGADINLDIPTVNFSSNNYSFDKNEVFLNGQLLTSGSSLDYVLVPPVTGSVRFSFGLFDQDTVSIRQS